VQLVTDISQLPDSLRGGAVSIGNFDGVHRGHARLVEQLKAAAREIAGPAIVFTFDPHPVRILRPKMAPPPLTWTDRKADLLGELGVDAMVAYPTDEELLALNPSEFFRRIVVEQLAARALVEGPNFFFGRDRTGDIDALRYLCGEHGVALHVVDPLQNDGDFVSSSRVRQAIAAGDVEAAAHMLTRPYRIRGMVTHGAGRGGRIGFPTANLEAIDTLLPAHGVYAGRAIAQRVIYPAAINVGPNPTFGEHSTKVEIHLIDFSGDLYHKALEVDFLARLRDIQPFDSVEALKSQLSRDVTRAREIAAP